MATTMTIKAFLTAISEGKISSEIQEFAKTRLEKEIASANARKTSEKALAKEAADIKLIETFLSTAKGETPYVASEIATLITKTSGTEISTPKATALMKKAVGLGKVVAGSTAVKGRSVKTYTVI